MSRVGQVLRQHLSIMHIFKYDVKTRSPCAIERKKDGLKRPWIGGWSVLRRCQASVESLFTAPHIVNHGSGWKRPFHREFISLGIGESEDCQHGSIFSCSTNLSSPVLVVHSLRPCLVPLGQLLTYLWGALTEERAVDAVIGRSSWCISHNWTCT